MEDFENIFELPEKVSTLYNIFKYCNFNYVNHLTLNNFYKDNIKINEGKDLQKILIDFKDFFNICNISDNYGERTFKLNFLYTNTINIDFSKLTTDSGLTEKSILYIRNYNFINSLFNLKGIDDENVKQIIKIWTQIINDSKNINDFIANINKPTKYQQINPPAGSEVEDFLKNVIPTITDVTKLYDLKLLTSGNAALQDENLKTLIQNVIIDNKEKKTVPVILFKQYTASNYEETEQSKKIFKILYILYILSKYNTTGKDKEKVTNIIKELHHNDKIDDLIGNISDITKNGNADIVPINILIQTFDKLHYNDATNPFLDIDKVFNQSDLPKDNEPKKSKIGEKLDELIGDNKQKSKDPSKIIDLKDENGRFIRNGENRDIIYNFAYKCLLNTDKNNRKNCFVNGIIGTDADSKIYHTLVNNIEVLRPDQLKILAWQLDLQKRLGRYESKKEWLDRYGNVMVERVVDKEHSNKENTVYKYGGAIAEFMKKNGDDDKEYNYFVVDNNNNKEERERRYKNCEKIFKFKCCLIDTLSNALNKNIYNADMKKDKDNTITSYNVAQSNRIIQNPYTIYNVPSLYWFMGGRYQFDENKTTAKELRRIYNNIKTNLESRNKIISQTDDESIIKAIDKIEEIEKQIGKILTNGFNYLQTVKDNNKKKITLDNLQQQVTEQATKALSMKEKLDKIVNYLIRESEKNGETLDDKSTLNDYYDGEWY